MRDDDNVRDLPLPVRVQPDPMLEEHHAGPFRIAVTALGATAIVVLALYGMSRAPEQQQMAAAPPASSETAPAPNAPTTTGQGSGDQKSGQPGTTGQGQAEPSKTPPAAGGAAGSDTGPGAKPAPEGR